MGTVILNVVIVLGIIIAGGFLIFFLGDLLISIIDPKGQEERIKNKKKDSAKKLQKKLEAMPAEDAEEVKENPVVSSILLQISEDKPQEEAKVEEFVPTAVEEAPVEEEKMEEETEEQSEEEKLAEARAALEKRKEEILRRMQAQLEEEEDEDEEDEGLEPVQEPAEEVAEEVEEEQVEEVVEETVEEEAVEEQNDETAAIKAELEEARRALEEERAKFAALSQELQSAREEGATIITAAPATPREELEAEKAELEARLKENEKEFKACKKEYLPLAKVNKTLANDEKKLRRKEAIVAKQKVMLYGVNNYEDIDEEKAKKLAEELDLLDGLKLSVQHCHEVMQNNKDRFPVLEKMYNILKAQNDQIKADLAEIEEQLKASEETDAE